MDTQDPASFYRHMFNPCTDPLIDHANKLGINLRTKELLPRKHGRVQKGAPRPYSSGGPHMTQVYGRAGSAHHGAGSHPTPTYIHNVVIPLNTPSETTSPYPSTLMSYSYSRSQSAIRLPKSRKGSAMSYLRSPSHTPSAFDKYSTSSPRERSSTSYTHAGNEKNASGQKLRFETEQTDLSQCRTRKLASQVRPHQVDRMYYMSGTPLRLEARYRVEEEELQRLRELSRSRKKANYYGRGLRSEEDEQESPHQPPPSSLGESDVVPEGAISPTDRAESPKVAAPERPDDLDSVSEGDLTGRKLDSHRSEDDAVRTSPPADEVAQELENLNVEDSQPDTEHVDCDPSDTQQQQAVPDPDHRPCEDDDSGVDNNSVAESPLVENVENN